MGLSAFVWLLQAIAATGKIVKSNPKHLEALQLRGMAYMYLGDHGLAKRHFGKPASAAPLGALALLLTCQFANVRCLGGPAAKCGTLRRLGCCLTHADTRLVLQCTMCMMRACVSPHWVYVYHDKPCCAAPCCAVSAGEALKYDPDHSASRKAFNKLKDLDRKRQRAEK